MGDIFAYLVHMCDVRAVVIEHFDVGRWELTVHDLFIAL